jgi:predicted lipoprotein
VDRSWLLDEPEGNSQATCSQIGNEAVRMKREFDNKKTVDQVWQSWVGPYQDRQDEYNPFQKSDDRQAKRRVTLISNVYYFRLVGKFNGKSDKQISDGYYDWCISTFGQIKALNNKAEVE